MVKIEEIVVGWKNYVFPNKEVEKIATNRMLACIGCPKLNKFTKTCGVCGCFMPSKVRNLKSRCPHPKGSKWVKFINPSSETK